MDDVKKVKYCLLYNQVCQRSWCMDHRGCGGGAYMPEMLTLDEAKKKIEDRKHEQLLKHLSSCIRNLNENKELLTIEQVQLLKKLVE